MGPTGHRPIGDRHITGWGRFTTQGIKTNTGSDRSRGLHDRHMYGPPTCTLLGSCSFTLRSVDRWQTKDPWTVEQTGGYFFVPSGKGLKNVRGPVLPLQRGELWRFRERAELFRWACVPIFGRREGAAVRSYGFSIPKQEIRILVNQILCYFTQRRPWTIRLGAFKPSRVRFYLFVEENISFQDLACEFRRLEWWPV